MKGPLVAYVLIMVFLNGTLGQESQVEVNHEGKAFTSLKHAWTAQWVTHPSASTLDYGVFHFRNRFELESVPSRFIIHVSADNRVHTIGFPELIISKGDGSNIKITYAEALVSLFVSGDDRLMRKSIQQFDDSRLPNGLTQSRYPSYIVQVIPTYSLLWIGMIHDYLMYRDDPEFTGQFLPGIKSVLGWFEERVDSTGMVTNLEWWNFTDWAQGFANGIPPGADNGYSANVALQYVYALQNAVDIFNYFGHTAEAEKYDQLKKSIQQATMMRCYDTSSGLIAETPEKQFYSQHTNIWAILTNTVAEEQQPQLMEKILAEKHLIQGTIYFKFYLFRALQKAGMGNKYLEMLAPWERMTEKGMTTFGERDINPRSECHGWSASPCFDLLHTVAGISPGSPGFETVMIQPNPGKLQEMEVEFPHPKGMILLSLKREGNRGLSGEIVLPAKLKGTFIWEDLRLELKEGLNEIVVN